MGLLANLRTGWTLSVDSLSVLRSNPELLAFPAISGVATGTFFVLLYAGVFVAGLLGDAAALVALFVLYFATTFVATLFTAALVHAVGDTFHGRDPDVGRSLRAAWRKRRTIAAWSVVAAVVGVLVQQLEESDNPLSRVLAGLFSVGWAVATFFVVPVVVFEDVDLRTTFERSAETFVDTWGETVGAGLGLGIIQFLLAAVAVALAVAMYAALAVASPLVGLGAGAFVLGLGLLAAYLVGQTIRGIAKTALYLYASEGAAPEAFDDFDFETLGGRTDRTAAGSDDRFEAQI